MAACRFSRQAEVDLENIARYTLQKWGELQAARYMDRLEACCERLASRATLGRRCDCIRPDLRRMERGSHIVFYRKEAGGVLVSRILHRNMLPEVHGFDDDEGSGVH